MTATALRERGHVIAHHDQQAISPAAPVILVPNDTMARDFPLRPFAIRHALSGHELLTLPRLAELAGRMPRDLIEFNAGNASIDQDPDTTPAVDLQPREIVHQIETCGAWMVLKRVEKLPEYRALIEEALLSVMREQGFATLKDAGFDQVEGFIFVSSPNATTPFHLDAEDNFFVQIHGEKFFHVYDNTDHAIANEADIERAMTRHRNLRHRDEFNARATTFHLHDGDGCYVPYQWPHWVRTGGAYSISMAITWRTRAARRNNELHFMNAFLRKCGLPQAAPGRHPLFDAIKLNAFRLAHRIAEPLRKSETMRRVLRRIALGRHANYYYGEK